MPKEEEKKEEEKKAEKKEETPATPAKSVEMTKEIARKHTDAEEKEIEDEANKIIEQVKKEIKEEEEAKKGEPEAKPKRIWFEKPEGDGLLKLNVSLYAQEIIEILVHATKPKNMPEANFEKATVTFHVTSPSETENILKRLGFRKEVVSLHTKEHEIMELKEKMELME